MISIITVSFNAGKSLQTTIDSILKQNYQSFEVIIIDNQSSDQSLEPIENLNDPRIKIFSEKDEGIYDAMNKGIKLAQNPILTFLNAGDYFVSDFLLQNVVNSRFYEKSLIGVCNLSDGSRNELFRPFKIGNFCHQTIFYYKLDDFFLNKKYPISADFELTSRLLNRNKKVIKIKGEIHYDRNGVSSRKVYQRNQEKVKILKQYLSLYRGRGLFTIIYLSLKLWMIRLT